MNKNESSYGVECSQEVRIKSCEVRGVPLVKMVICPECSLKVWSFSLFLSEYRCVCFPGARGHESEPFRVRYIICPNSEMHDKLRELDQEASDAIESMDRSGQGNDEVILKAKESVQRGYDGKMKKASQDAIQLIGSCPLSEQFSAYLLMNYLESGDKRKRANIMRNHLKKLSQG